MGRSSIVIDFPNFELYNNILKLTENNQFFVHGSIFMMNYTLMVKENCQNNVHVSSWLPWFLWPWKQGYFSLRWLSFCLRIITVDPCLIISYKVFYEFRTSVITFQQITYNLKMVFFLVRREFSEQIFLRYATYQDHH